MFLSMEISDLDMKNIDDWLFSQWTFYEDIYELISTKDKWEFGIFQAYNTELGYQALNLSTSSPKQIQYFDFQSD